MLGGSWTCSLDHAPLNQFLRLLWRPLMSVFFSMLYRGPRSVSLHTILGPPAHFLDLLYAWGPLGSVSSYTIWGPLSDQCHCLLYAPPPPPLRSVSLHAIARGPPQISFFIKYMGVPSDQFLKLTIYMGPPQVSFFAYNMGPFRSVSVHTIWGPSQISVFSYYSIWGPTDQFLCLLYGDLPEISFFAYYMRAPLRSVSSLTIWVPIRSFFRILFKAPLRSASLLTIWGP